MKENDLHRLILERNSRETIPFLTILESNATLLNNVGQLQYACELAKREISHLRLELHDKEQGPDFMSTLTGGRYNSVQAALKNETRLRENIESLQEEVDKNRRMLLESQADSLRTSEEVRKLGTVTTEQREKISNLKEENMKAEFTIARLTEEIKESKSQYRMAEDQFERLKNTIRTIQEENDTLRRENVNLEKRLMTDKSNLIEEMNGLNEIIEGLKNNIDILKSWKHKEDCHSRLRGNYTAANGPTVVSEKHVCKKDETEGKLSDNAIFIPSFAKTVVPAHAAEGMCVRYDQSGRNLVATCSIDSTVKVWDTVSGSLLSTFRGTNGHTIISCDISGNTVVGAGSDKTCRLWNVRTGRMVHHLVGHQHKITCLRLFDREHSVITGSADHSLKIWDVSRNTYRQTVTLRHSSTSNCVDIGQDAVSAVSGHMDGGLRFWDIRSGDKTLDITGLHESGICSVQFDLNTNRHVLTSSLDSTLKLFDIRNCVAVHTFQHEEFSTLHTSLSRGVLSPDSRYVASGTSSSGNLFLWDTVDSSLQKKIPGHDAGIIGIDWRRGRSNEQQLVTLDRKGQMILWA